MSSYDVPPPPALDIGQLLVLQKRHKIFESQIYDTGFFDVTFDIEGKPLYAHRLELAYQSEPFQRMFSTLWSSPDVSIQIHTSSFNDFKTFLGFMYFAPLQLTNTNFITMVDLAESYNVQWIKDKCDEWLSTQKVFSPLLRLYEATKNFSLAKSKTAILSYIVNSCSNFNGFSKVLIIEVLTFHRSYASEESLFIAVYEWASNEHRRLGESSNGFKDAMKKLLADVFPLFKYEGMSKQFFEGYICNIKRIFENERWEAIKSIFDKPQVILKSSNLNLRGMILADEKIVDSIKSLKNEPPNFSHFDTGCNWYKEILTPTNRNQIAKKENVLFYPFINFENHSIGVIPSSMIRAEHFLLAELYGTGNRFSSECRISIE